MIELLSLFLGLVDGVHAVELAVTDPVAVVELRLDGENVGVLRGEPWRHDCDFGVALAPHELTVIARDENGGELERVRRWINVAVVKGGEHRTSTAVAVRLEEGFELPPVEEMQGWFLHRGEPVPVEGVETGGAEVVIVREPTAQTYLDAVADFFYDTSLEYLRSRAPAGTRLAELDAADRERWRTLVPEELAPLEAPAVARAQASLRGFALLGQGARVRFISPLAAPPSRVDQPMQLFHQSERHSSQEGGFLWLARRTEVSPFFRPSDAAAIAARDVHAGGQRRAVVLLLGNERADQSLFKPDVLRGYLRDLQVPLIVWSTTTVRTRSQWGPVRRLRPASYEKETWRASFADAVGELRAELEAQRVVWLRGRYLPHTIELGADARGLRLAGDPAVP